MRVTLFILHFRYFAQLFKKDLPDFNTAGQFYLISPKHVDLL